MKTILDYKIKHLVARSIYCGRAPKPEEVSVEVGKEIYRKLYLDFIYSVNITDLSFALNVISADYKRLKGYYL